MASAKDAGTSNSPATSFGISKDGSTEHPEDIATRVMYMPSVYMCTRVAIDLKLFNIITSVGHPISSSELADKTKTDEQLLGKNIELESLSRHLYQHSPYSAWSTYVGLVEEAGTQIYAANAATRHVENPSVQATLIHFYDAGLKSLYYMPEYFRKNGYQLPTDSTSGPLQYAFNTPLESYAYWKTLPTFAENFNIAMAGKLTANKTGQTWSNSYPVHELVVGFDAKVSDAMFVDVAGGTGHEVSQFKARFPFAPGRFILEELPGIIDAIKELDEGIETIKYDFFTPQPVKRARVYFLANIMHNWTDKDCLRILSNIVAVMEKGYSKILLSDHILPERNCPLPSVGRDIGMLSLHSGVERSEKQWKILLEAAGLKVVKFYHLGRGEGLVDAQLAD